MHDTDVLARLQFGDGVGDDGVLEWRRNDISGLDLLLVVPELNSIGETRKDLRRSGRCKRNTLPGVKRASLEGRAQVLEAGRTNVLRRKVSEDERYKRKR
jgi:hypothetical protein